MKFDKIIGGDRNTPENKSIIAIAENKMSGIFAELALEYDNYVMGTRLGGDAYLWQMLAPYPHILDLSTLTAKILLNQLDELKIIIAEKYVKGENISEEQKQYETLEQEYKTAKKGIATAATNGKAYYWSAEFINKLSQIGLRLVQAHEGGHAQYMHNQRRLNRLLKLWNIAVDFKINYGIMCDLFARRERNPIELFTKHLGQFITFHEYKAFLINPYNPPPKLDHFNPLHDLRSKLDPIYIHPGTLAPPMFYAEPDLPEALKRPEHIYEELNECIPRCKLCNRFSVYDKPVEYKKLEKQLGKKVCCIHHDHQNTELCCNHNHDHSSDGFKCDAKDHCNNCGCDKCNKSGPCSYVDVFNCGDTQDEHMPCEVSEDEIAKRMQDAMEIAKQVGQKLSKDKEEELKFLNKPRMRWQDFYTITMCKKRSEDGKPNWSMPRRKMLGAGLYVPSKSSNKLTFLCAYDCSMSMTNDDVSYGIEQLQILGNNAEGYLLSWSMIAHWDEMIKINKVSRENLQKAKLRDRTGTSIINVFDEYEKHCKNVGMIIIITDGYILKQELLNLKRPKNGVQTIWLLTAHNSEFNAPFGKTFHINNERI